MNLPQLMSAVDYASDCTLEAAENEDAYRERIADYIADRAKQIQEKRLSNLSDEDFIIAFEAMQTLPTVMHDLKALVYREESLLASVMRDWIDAMLRADSRELARTEALAKFHAADDDTRH